MRLPNLVHVLVDVPVARTERDREFDRTEQMFRALFAQDEQQAVAEVAGQLGRGLRASVNFVMVGGPREMPSGPAASQWPSGSVALRLGRGAYGISRARVSFVGDRLSVEYIIERRANRGQA